MGYWSSWSRTSWPGVEAGAEVLALEHLLEGDAGVELEDFLVGHLPEPVAVVDDLGFGLVEDLEGLVGVGGGVDEHLVAGERRAGGGAAGRIADGGGEITDEQHGLVTEELELAELFQGDGVAEVDVGRRGIDAELDAQRAAEAEFFEQLLFGKDLGGSGDKMGELLFG